MTSCGGVSNMATLDQIYAKVEQLRDELSVVVASAKLNPKQITIIQGLSEINASLGVMRAGEFLALSDGEDPQDADGTGTFISALGRTFASKLYHIGGVFNGDLKWGANAITGELEAGDGAVNLTANGLSLYDGATEIGRFGNLAGFLSYPATPAVYGMAMGDADQYMTYDQTNGLKIYGALVSDREILTADRAYYVATTGDDGNSGLTVGAPFLTIQHAIDVIADNLDTRGYNISIQLADGTYTLASTLSCKNINGTGTVTLIGNITTPSNVVLQTTTGTINVITVDNVKTKYKFEGFKLLSTKHGFYIVNGSFIELRLLDFGAVTNNHIDVERKSYALITGEYTISGGGIVHFSTATTGEIDYQGAGITITVSGTPAFIYFAASSHFGILYVPNITWSGSATGSRYLAVYMGIIDTVGGGANYFPGDSAGSAATNGLYK